MTHFSLAPVMRVVVRGSHKEGLVEEILLKRGQFQVRFTGYEPNHTQHELLLECHVLRFYKSYEPAVYWQLGRFS